MFAVYGLYEWVALWCVVCVGCGFPCVGYCVTWYGCVMLCDVQSMM